MRITFLLSGMALLSLLLSCATETAEVEYSILAQKEVDSACIVLSSQHRAYYWGVNKCLQNDELKLALHHLIKNHRVLPYTRNTGSFPTHFTKQYISLGNFAEGIPERFDVWDAYIVFAAKGANPYRSSGNCPPDRLLDWYDYRCYETPEHIMVSSSGGQQSAGGADPLAAPEPLWGNQGVYNREHSWPKDFFEANTPSGYCQSKPEITGQPNKYYDYRAYTDLHHLLPARQAINVTRGTCAFGIVLTPDTHFPRASGAKIGTPDVSAMPGYSFPGGGILGCSSNKVLEPPPEVKGDIARIYFYMATRYYTEDSCWNSNYQVDKANIRPWLESLLRSWHQMDPVSEEERLRNDWIHRIQNNRNPFVDYPEFVDQISDF